ncbi:MAG: biotin carboxylase N-terminal domain-containing protein, partial [Pacificimonas sp.]
MRRLLIANRGEIAIRVMRTATEMGIETVAVVGSDDRHAPHAAHADEVIDLRGSGTAAYLNIEAIVEAARTSGADAVHPGYGFLSERTDFARAVEAAGLTFVGPTPETLALFGDKVSASARAAALGIPVLSLGDGPLNLNDATTVFADLPDGTAMMLKAVAGGGGRGVRIVQTIEELPDAIARASAEAQAAFGDGRLYAERFLSRARHIEVQIVGDGRGAVQHLGTRECSLQRRHQKLLE